ncbi:HNH endonuclease [Paenisporosarcina sp. TG20]|uniref:HNH endonuclease n=1 Tax=Paenisporosarcina sp. TG20 TaxID=1211706 RepID=UPI0003045CCD|nr:HNH endonuclease [Paenisporosarcina sp. TG20]
MGVFRFTGKVATVTLGSVAKGGVYLISKAIATKNENVGRYVGEVGEVVINSSEQAVDSVAQFSDGTVQSLYGLLKKESYHKKQGWLDIKDSTGRTVRGLSKSINYTVSSTRITLTGIRNKNRQQILQGIGNLGKVVVVTTVAVGVLDIVDGSDMGHADPIETRNDSLDGLEHSETGVLFLERTIELPNGDINIGTFPIFDSNFSVILTEDLYLATDNVHFQIANETLSESIQQSPNITNDIGISEYDVQNLATGITPEGYDWHHSEQPGVLQLVNEEIHQNTGHTGGREIWGGGSEYR